jgi:hypothetical protein
VTEGAYPSSGPERAEAHPPDLVILAVAAKHAGLADAVRDLATPTRWPKRCRPAPGRRW